MLLGKGLTEKLVVDTKIIDGDPTFRDPSGAAGLENKDGTIGVSLGHPTANRPPPEPLVLERREAAEIFKDLDVVPRIEVQFSSEFEPERRSRLWVEVPLHDFPHIEVERFLRFLYFRVNR